MNTITLTAEQAATFTDTGRVVLVEPGDVEVCGVCNGHDISHSGDVNSSCDSCRGGANDVPPAEWAALTGACETCVAGIVPTTRAVTNGPILPEYGPCPSCGGTGHPLATVVTACCHNVATCRDFSRPHCAWRTDGTADGTVTLGTATAEQVQIVRSGTGHDLDACMVVGFDPSNGGAHFRNGRVVHVYDLGPDPDQHVGSWALILTRKGES